MIEKLDHVHASAQLTQASGWRWATRGLALAALVLLQVSCGFNVGIGLIDLKTRSRVFLPSDGYREVIVNVQEEQRQFQAFQRTGDQLRMRTIGFDGRILGQKTIPLLVDRPAANKNTYAVSPDASRVVYHDFSTQGLRLYDIASGADTALMDRVASTGVEIAGMWFLSPQEVLLFLLADHKLGRGRAAVVRLNIETGEARTIVEPLYCFPGDMSLSRSKRYLVYWEGRKKHDIYGDARVLDLTTSAIVGTVTSSGDVLLSDPCVSPNEQLVACVIDDAIVVAPLSGSPVRVVLRLPRNWHCYYLAFLDDSTLLYRAGRGPGMFGPPLRTLDIASGKTALCTKAAFNGDIFVVENGGRLLCELGY